MALLRRNPDNWCHEIPVTALPQTKRRYTVSTEARLEQLTRIIIQEKQQQTKTADDSCPDDEEVIQVLRSNPVARHLASLIMVPLPGRNSATKVNNHHLEDQLQRIWPRLLELPPEESGAEYDYEISLILPAYSERAEDVQRILMHSMRNSKQPNHVQVVVVDAGGCPGLSETLLNKDSSSTWGRIQIVPYTAGGGRGSSLNYGAMHARGKILTFLHADTLLPDGWDVMVRQALSSNKGGRIAHACAFTMGIDLSPDGLKGGRCPPGIVGAEYLGYLRCRLCSLPYGDSALSFPASVFHYLGGYPDQPLMEDFEIMKLLRKRARILNEKLVILPARALTSPRRWQQYGVCYTVLVNALCIYQYNNWATAEDIFQFYYRRPIKKTS